MEIPIHPNQSLVFWVQGLHPVCIHHPLSLAVQFILLPSILADIENILVMFGISLFLWFWRHTQSYSGTTPGSVLGSCSQRYFGNHAMAGIEPQPPACKAFTYWTTFQPNMGCFWLSQQWYYWHLVDVGKARDFTKFSTMPGPLHKKVIWTKMSIVPRLKSCGLVNSIKHTHLKLFRIKLTLEIMAK